MLKTPVLMNNTLKVLKIVKQNTTLRFYERKNIKCFMRLKL